jgi:hypothetical protein
LGYLRYTLEQGFGGESLLSDGIAKKAQVVAHGRAFADVYPAVGNSGESENEGTSGDSGTPGDSSSATTSVFGNDQSSVFGNDESIGVDEVLREQDFSRPFEIRMDSVEFDVEVSLDYSGDYSGDDSGNSESDSSGDPPSDALFNPSLFAPALFKPILSFPFLEGNLVPAPYPPNSRDQQGMNLDATYVVNFSN